MIPYVVAPAVHLGPYAIPVYGVLLFSSILVGHSIILRRAVGSGLDDGATRELIFWCTIAGLSGSHLWWLASLATPAIANDIFSLHGMVSFGGILGISTGIFILTLLKRPQVPRGMVLKWFDAATYAMVFGFCIGRIGCALEHDHLGIRSRSILAVAFPGGSRFDLGLLEVLFLIPLAIAVWFAGRRSWSSGFLSGTIFMIYGIFRVCLDSVRLERAYIFGISEDIWGGGVMILLGFIGLLLSGREEIGGTSRISTFSNPPANSTQR